MATNASGVATASTFTANNSTGTYNVTATASGLPTVNFTLTNTAPPAPAVTSVQNAASLAQGAIAPGEIVLISGPGLGPPVKATGVARSCDWDSWLAARRSQRNVRRRGSSHRERVRDRTDRHRSLRGGRRHLDQHGGFVQWAVVRAGGTGCCANRAWSLLGGFLGLGRGAGEQWRLAARTRPQTPQTPAIP